MSDDSQTQPTEQSLYDTRAIPAKDFAWITVRFGWLSQGWECRRATGGVVYLRKHISGPRNTEAGWHGWA